MSKQSTHRGPAPLSLPSEDEFIFEAMTRAIAAAGIAGIEARETLAHALDQSGSTSLGDVRASLVAAGTPEHLVDAAVKAGIVARASARFDFTLAAMGRSAAYQERSWRFVRNPGRSGCQPSPSDGDGQA